MKSTVLVILTICLIGFTVSTTVDEDEKPHTRDIKNSFFPKDQIPRRKTEEDLDSIYFADENPYDIISYIEQLDAKLKNNESFDGGNELPEPPEIENRYIIKVPPRCPTGYRADETGTCRRVFGASQK